MDQQHAVPSETEARRAVARHAIQSTNYALPQFLLQEASAKGEKARANEKASFEKAQNERRMKAKGMRDNANKSRTDLKSSRAEAGIKLREEKAKLAEQLAANRKKDEETRKGKVNAVIASIAYDPGQDKEGSSSAKLAAPTGIA